MSQNDLGDTSAPPSKRTRIDPANGHPDNDAQASVAFLGPLGTYSHQVGSGLMIRASTWTDYRLYTGNKRFLWPGHQASALRADSRFVKTARPWAPLRLHANMPRRFTVLTRWYLQTYSHQWHRGKPGTVSCRSTTLRSDPCLKLPKRCGTRG